MVLIKIKQTMNQKLKITGIILFASFVFLSSCEVGEEPGPLATEERILSAFDGIHVETIGKVNLHVAQEFRVVIHTHANVLDDITLSIFEEDLSIRLNGKHTKIDRLEIDVYAPEYTSIKLDGVADIRCRELITTSQLSIEQDGVGNIYLADIDVQKASFRLDEVGDVVVEGHAGEIAAIHDGVGNLRLFGLSGKKGDCKLSGTGNIEINVSDYLKIDLNGVGDIRYMGTPSMNVNHTGIGKIVKVN